MRSAAVQANHVVWLNEEDTRKLRSLGDFKNLVLIITKPYLMRGFDYRCSHGIELLLCRSFDHERALAQALGRVGRYNDYGKRYRLPGLELVNKDLKAAYIGSLVSIKSQQDASKVS